MQKKIKNKDIRTASELFCFVEKFFIQQNSDLRSRLFHDTELGCTEYSPSSMSEESSIYPPYD
uniref:Uncharacterized protein n=1 Tax=Anguilla anguilla TaxID=7936 RepID=A0A0E9WQK6_ANGAN